MYYTVIEKWSNHTYWEVLESFEEVSQAGGYYQNRMMIQKQLYTFNEDLLNNYELDIVQHEFPLIQMVDASGLVKFDNGVVAMWRRL